MWNFQSHLNLDCPNHELCTSELIDVPCRQLGRMKTKRGSPASCFFSHRGHARAQSVAGSEGTYSYASSESASHGPPDSQQESPDQ